MKEKTFTVRGYLRGKQAKPTECDQCGETIMVGEQYFNGDGGCRLCLGCYFANNDPTFDDAVVYIASTDRV